MEEKIKERKMCMDFRYKYIEIKVVMVSGEVHIIKQRFALDSGVEEIINFLTRDKYIYTYEGAWINSSLIEEFDYTVLN